ncbi:uncharacterized protein F4817DRAFT_312762 [Daldinia loculata]|uniref:uncharacterized protein n=1 Tax=Daldinia loculata TaxID=103429 RepID=UPI0020C3F894|nr:uncharacterized protein F4817DRAFT_312762 [Daldinia loculata]KAI1650394.1 hypothetical protein F4817DRAFT_312762 [Daldinia loculata]
MPSKPKVPADHSKQNVNAKKKDDELDLSDLQLIKDLRWKIDRIPILEKFRRTLVGDGNISTNREEYLRMKLHQEYPKLYATVLKNISAEGRKLASPEKIKEIAEIFLQIAGGFHKKWFFTLKTDSFNVRLTKFRKTPTTVPHLETFHMFQKLPRELRAMIWGFAVWAQNRFVGTYRLRKIKSAPCPVLFLTCKESKFWATKLYKRVKNGDLLYGRIMPASREARGPVISFENDIVMTGDWRLWNSYYGYYSKEVVKLQSAGQALRPIHKRIEALCRRAFHRVVLQRPHYVHPELIFYKNARKHVTTFPKYGGRNDWGWAWTDNIEEVWTIDGVHNYIDNSVKKHLARVFPPVPGDDCFCSLCERADIALGRELPYQKPDPQDIKEHERIFDMVDARSNWEGESMPQGLNINM